jgi:hypothetical protein
MFVMSWFLTHSNTCFMLCVSLFFFHFLRAPSAHLRRQTKIDQTSTTIVWLPIKGMQVARHDNKFGIPSDFFTGRCTLVII